MKKMLFCIIAALLIISSIATGFAEVQPFEIEENFSVRKGIQFGCSKNNVETIETNNGNEADEVDTYYGENSYDLAYSTALIGYEANVIYWFDENGKLDEFQYMLFQNKAYNDVKASLTQKYGAPLFNEQSYIASTKIDASSKELNILKPSDRDYAGWIIKYNDCFVMLEMKHVYYTNAGGLSLYLINYDLLSYEDMNLYTEAMEALEVYLNSSYSNDL
ncbi:MAG: hypothetical protein IKW00_02590 [Clostridia bacterium]|nr:hypothetical protein [Clostridia bacterium]